MQISGTIKVINDTQKVSEKFSKREFILTTEAESKFPQHLSVQVTQDKCSMLDQFNVGDEVICHINLRGREWSGAQGIKYFNTIEAWRIEKTGSVQQTPVENNPFTSDDLGF